MSSSPNVRYADVLGFFAASWLVYKIWQGARTRSKITNLLGPPAKGWLFGVTKDINDSDIGEIFEKWSKEYGDVFQIPGPLGERRTVLLDPKAIAYVFSKTQSTYIKNKFVKKFIENIVGFFIYRLKFCINILATDRKRADLG